MPFTLAHPAIVVPLPRLFPRFLVLSALVVGSMAPDFEYFAYLRPLRTIGHDLIGIPLLCVPSGLLVLGVYEHLIKGPLIALLPASLRRRLRPFARPAPLWQPAGRLVAIVGSLALGAFSHIAWDAFTHEHGWVVERVPPLAATLLDLGGYPPLKVYKALQYGGTIVGLALIGWWSAAWVARQPETPEPRDEVLPARRRIATIAVLAIAPALFGLALGLRAAGGRAYRLTVRSVVPAISAAFLLAAGYGALDRRLLLRSRPEEPAILPPPEPGGLPGRSNSS